MLRVVFAKAMQPPLCREITQGIQLSGAVTVLFSDVQLHQPSS